MKKNLLLMLSTLMMFFATTLPANASNPGDIKAAFIRNGNVWTYINSKEKQITTSGKVIGSPQWSFDGEWFLYQQEAPSIYSPGDTQSEIWAYQIGTGKNIKVFDDGFSPKWAPDQNIVAFQDRGILNISDLKRFSNVAAGVFTYSWLPDKKGFLLSSQAELLPDGWTNPKLYKKKLTSKIEEQSMFNGVEPFFIIPKEVGIGNKKINSIYADGFKFSPSNKWISFIVSPTASLAMDSNMLCVLSSDGKRFEVLDEVIRGVGGPNWAPTRDILAYISGGGRIVFGFKDKKLKIREFPVSGSLTPTSYMELDFTWIDNHTLITSRAREKEWSNDFTKHPLPSLYSIKIDNTRQTRITAPPKGVGDYSPQYLSKIEKIIWLRGKSITDSHKSAWISDREGGDAKQLLADVDKISFYRDSQ
ncbi:TolB family protein [Pseudalkalibacillus caeni]|uniref:TolB domain-containing protein n=1 Tax=Exobacillus caeni TaxID=2574798 RepID=A0A5R9F0L4_9BACL|nr:hypothetical protein [Pseudalkalibacillus caeni]TLS34958.1 hypothetical protein FCL54_22890 [Pseudalkalibacillus caeni]